MPAHSFLISSAQGLPVCATAAEPDSSSAVSTTNPDRTPATLDFLHRDSKMRIRIYRSRCFETRRSSPKLGLSICVVAHQLREQQLCDCFGPRPSDQT